MNSEVLVYDLYSGPGGVGYALDAIADEYDLQIRHVGVDIDDHGDTYPGEFVQADASRPPLQPGPDVLWLSPPCLRYTPLVHVCRSRYGWDDDEIERRYPDFEDLRVREVIAELDPEHYIIENVAQCHDLRGPARLNGQAFGKPYQLERRFETSFDTPDQIGRGEPLVTISSRSDGNDEYQLRELADAKGVPVEWGEQAVHSAIPREYVQYLLYYCPSAPDVPLPENMQQSQLTQHV